MDTVSLDERLAQMSRELREELAAGKDLAGDFFCRMGKLMAEHLLSRRRWPTRWAEARASVARRARPATATGTRPGRCGPARGGSSWTCKARHSATRTAVGSSAADC